MLEKNSLLEVNTVKKLFSSVLVRDKNTVTKLTVKQIYISVLGKDQYSVRKKHFITVLGVCDFTVRNYTAFSKPDTTVLAV